MVNKWKAGLGTGFEGLSRSLVSGMIDVFLLAENGGYTHGREAGYLYIC